MIVTRRIERVLLACGIVALLFLVVFVLAGAVRPDFDPLRHPVSSLSLNGQGWVQAANFVITGVLLLAYSVGLRTALRVHLGGARSVPWLIAAVGIGLIGAGIFPADPLSGYPPGTPMAPPVATVHGILHDLFSTPVFLALPAACIVLTVRLARIGRPGWAVYSGTTAAVFLTGFVLAGAGFSQVPTLMPIAGLLQRLTLLVGWAWLAVLAIDLLRRGDRNCSGTAAPT